MEWDGKLKFIPARTPCFGGIWEMCIGILKSRLFNVSGKAILTYEEMCSLLIELEMILNDHPVAYQLGGMQKPEILIP